MLVIMGDKTYGMSEFEAWKLINVLRTLCQRAYTQLKKRHLLN